MHMVWHDDKCVCNNSIKMIGYLQPGFFNHFANIIQYHLPINNLAEEVFSPLGDNGDEISPILAIIIPGQAKCFAVSGV